MRHQKTVKKLGRTHSHRKAMLKNMATSLLKFERIKTTRAKAKVLKQFVEPIITRAKEKNLHNIREIYKKIRNRKIIQKLFDNIAPRYKDRPGGYTRILNLMPRTSDSSNMAIIELVEEQIETGSEGKSKKKKKDK